MAKLRANVKPVSCQPDYHSFEGTCSNCRAKRVEVIKVKGAQVCVKRCIGGVSYPEPPEGA